LQSQGEFSAPIFETVSRLNAKQFPSQSGNGAQADYGPAAQGEVIASKSSLVNQVFAKIIEAAISIFPEKKEALSNLSLKIVDSYRRGNFNRETRSCEISEAFIDEHDEDEIAWLIGHEVAHSILKSGKVNLLAVICGVAGMMNIFILGHFSKPANEIAMSAFALFILYLTSKIYFWLLYKDNRANEFKADLLGLIFSCKVGYGLEAGGVLEHSSLIGKFPVFIQDFIFLVGLYDHHPNWNRRKENLKAFATLLTPDTDLFYLASKMLKLSLSELRNLQKTMSILSLPYDKITEGISGRTIYLSGIDGEIIEAKVELLDLANAKLLLNWRNRSKNFKSIYTNADGRIKTDRELKRKLKQIKRQAGYLVIKANDSIQAIVEYKIQDDNSFKIVNIEAAPWNRPNEIGENYRSKKKGSVMALVVMVSELGLEYSYGDNVCKSSLCFLSKYGMRGWDPIFFTREQAKEFLSDFNAGQEERAKKLGDVSVVSPASQEGPAAAAPRGSRPDRDPFTHSHHPENLIAGCFERDFAMGQADGVSRNRDVERLLRKKETARGAMGPRSPPGQNNKSAEKDSLKRFLKRYLYILVGLGVLVLIIYAVTYIVSQNLFQNGNYSDYSNSVFYGALAQLVVFIFILADLVLLGITIFKHRNCLIKGVSKAFFKSADLSRTLILFLAKILFEKKACFSKIVSEEISDKKQLSSRLAHIVLPLGISLGSLYILGLSFTEKFENFSTAITYLSAIGILASLPSFVGNIKRIFERKPPGPFFGLSKKENDKLTIQGRSVLIQLADQAFTKPTEKPKFDLVSIIKRIFQPRRFVFMAIGAAAAAYFSFSISAGALFSLIAPYLCSVIYNFFCSSINYYKFRGEFIREHLKDVDSIKVSECQSVNGIKNAWNVFTLRFPVAAGIFAFFAVKIQVIFWSYVIGSAILPFISVNSANISVTELFLRYYQPEQWEWGYNFSLQLTNISNSLGFVYAWGDFIRLGIIALGLTMLAMAGQLKKINLLTPLKFIAKSWVNFVHLWLIIAIIGTLTPWNLTSITNVPAANVTQGIHRVLGGKEDVSTWQKANLLYRQMKVNPQTVLQMDIGEDELELLLGEFKAEEVVKLTGSIRDDPRLNSLDIMEIEGEIREVKDKVTGIEKSILSLKKSRANLRKEYENCLRKDRKKISDLLGKFEQKYRYWTPDAELIWAMGGHIDGLMRDYEEAYQGEYKKYKRALESVRRARARKFKQMYNRELKKYRKPMAQLGKQYKEARGELAKLQVRPEPPEKPRVRRFCLFLAGLRDTPRAKGIISRYQNDRDNDTNTMAKLILAKDGDKKAARKLTKSSFRRGGLPQEMGIANFGSANFSYSTNFLFNNLNNGWQPGNRIASLTALKSKLGKPRVKSAYVWALGDFDPRVVATAISYSAPWAGPKVMAKIVKLRSSTDIGVKQAVFSAVGLRLDDYPKYANLLSDGLKSKNPQIFETSFYAAGPHLNKFPQFRQPFIDVVRSESRPVELSQFALHSLSVVHTPTVKELYRSNLEHPDWQRREGATFGLSRFGSSDIPDLLAPRFEDPARQVRQTMGLSLGNRLKSYPKLVDPFISTMKAESDPYTRHIFAAALKTIPNYPDVKENWNSVQEALMPGLRIGGWEKIRPETGVEIGYNTIAGPVNHTFLSVVYQGKTKIISFDTADKPFGFLLPQSRGVYEKAIRPSKNIVYYTLTTDPKKTKELFDSASDLYDRNDFYNFFNIKNLGKNCYGGRNFALESFGIRSDIPDMPLSWTALKPNYFSRSITMDSSDQFHSYSARIKQDVLYSFSGERTVNTSSYYTTRTWSSSNFNSQRALPNSWTNRSFQTGSSLNTNFRWKTPSFSSTGFSMRSWSSFSFPRSYFRSSFMPRTYSPPQRYIPPPRYTPPPRYNPPTLPSNPWP